MLFIFLYILSRLYTLQVHLSKWGCGVLHAVVQDRDASFRSRVWGELLCALHLLPAQEKNSPFCLQRSGLFLQSSPLFDGAESRLKAVGGSMRKKTGGGVLKKDKSVIFAHLCVEKPFVSKKKTTFAVELLLNLLSTPPCKKDYFFSSWRCSLL